MYEQKDWTDNEQLYGFLFSFSLDALSQTTEWLKESIDKELLSETDVAPAAEHSSTPSLSPLLVLNNCYLKLLQWDYQKKVLPEVSGFVLPQDVQCLDSRLWPWIRGSVCVSYVH
jgi:hypothetical protein